MIGSCAMFAIASAVSDHFVHC